MIIDRLFMFYVSGNSRKSKLLNWIKLVYWRIVRRQDIIGFYLGIPIRKSHYLKDEFQNLRITDSPILK